MWLGVMVCGGLWWMRWCIQRCQEGLPAFGAEVELLPIGEGFSRSGQGAIEHEVADAALGCCCGLLQGFSLTTFF